MRIKTITFQHRNDFCAILECEHCETTQELKTGYNDDYYHNHVIPGMFCKNCNKDRAGNEQPKLEGK